MRSYFIALILVPVSIMVMHFDWVTFLGNPLSNLLPASPDASVKLMSKTELSLFNGDENSKGLYLAILGQVFNVDKGRKHYGPGGGYHFFAGKDASRAFVTGEFTDTGLTDDVSGLSPAQVVALFDWLAFYKKDYKPVGKLIGQFYSKSGEATEAMYQVEALLEEGQRLKAQTKAENEQLPACNSEWNSAKGGRFWCSTKSGGVDRDWVGVPRKYFSPGSGRSRCVCVQHGDPSVLDNPNLQEYHGCPAQAHSCPAGSLNIN